MLDKIKDYRVLVVGDAILDEYRYAVPIGKSIKEPVISTRFERSEVFHGGAWAAAKHLTELCKQVDVHIGARVMHNTFYIDPTYGRKLFTVHESRDTEDIPMQPDYAAYDLVIVTDFGHGAMTRELIASISKNARFLAVNAQTNSTNYGFNMITRYRRADFIVIDELEARLAAHEKDAPIEDVILALGYRNIIVTLGKNGAIGFDGTFWRHKAVADRVLDTMGAGDAFLCVSAPFAAAGLPMNDLVRIGNAAGAAKVAITGHQTHVTRKALEAYL
jgi:sugar/nucleoside kinase (ribokinase family)